MNAKDRLRIRSLFLKGEFEESVKSLKNMLNNDPNLKHSIEFSAALGAARGLLGENEKSLHLLQRTAQVQQRNQGATIPSFSVDLFIARFNILFHEDRKADECYNLFVENFHRSGLGWCDRGIFLYHQGKLGPALESLEIALNRGRENVLALGYLALTQQTTNHPSAQNSMRYFAATLPRTEIDLLGKAEVHHCLGDFETAREYINKALEANPGSLAAHYLKFSNLKTEKRHSLIRKFEKKLENSGFNLTAFHNLPEDRFYVMWKILYLLEHSSLLKGEKEGASVQMAQGSPAPGSLLSAASRTHRPKRENSGIENPVVAASTRDLRTLNREQFKIADTYFQKGKDKMEQKNYNDAIHFFMQAVVHNQDHIPALNEIGLIYLSTGDDEGYRIDQAVQYFNKILKRDPEFAQAHYNKFIAFLIVGNHPEALASIDMAISLEPDNVEYRIDKAVLLSSLNRDEYAIEVLEETLRLAPHNATAWMSLAFSYKNLGNKKMEVKCLNEFLKREPKDVNAWFERGITFKRFGKYDTAIKCFDKIMTLEKGHYLAMKEKGTCLKLMGQKELGEQLIRQAEENRAKYIMKNKEKDLLQDMGIPSKPKR